MALPVIKGPNDFPFKHSGQPDQYGQSLGGDFAQVQADFDSRAEYNQTQINAIITALASITLGDDGAKQIGLKLNEITATNVNGAILELYNAIIGIVLNPAVIPDNSLTNLKLATDIKVGSLALLSTTVKTDVVSSINEVDSDLTTHEGLTASTNAHGLDSSIAKFKSGNSTYTDNDTSQTFTDTFCTTSSMVVVSITSVTKPQGVWTVTSNTGTFTITSTVAESADITFDYYITKVV